MSENGIRTVFDVKSADEERIIPDAILDSLDYLSKDLFCCIHKDLVEIFLMANLFQETRQRLYPHEFVLNQDQITKSKKILKVAKCDRCTSQPISRTPSLYLKHTSPTAIAITFHNARRRMREGKCLNNDTIRNHTWKHIRYKKGPYTSFRSQRRICICIIHSNRLG